MRKLTGRFDPQLGEGLGLFFVVAILIIVFWSGYIFSGIVYYAFPEPEVKVIGDQKHSSEEADEASQAEIKKADYQPDEWRPEKEAEVWYDIMESIYKESNGSKRKFIRALSEYMTVSRIRYYAESDNEKDHNKAAAYARLVRREVMIEMGLLEDPGLEIKTKSQHTRR